MLGFSPARLFPLLSLLPLFFSVPSAFSVCSALSLFFLSRHSSHATRLPRPGRGVFSAPSVLNPAFLLFLLSVNSALSVCSALSLFFLVLPLFPRHFLS